MIDRPLGVATMIACLVFLVAGIAWPQAAEALLRLLVLTLAVGFVVARAYQAMLPARTTQDTYSPFDDAPPTPPAAPQALQRLTNELGAADDARLARRTAVPWPVRWTVIEEASRRLAEHHGLSLGEPSHHPGIRSLVSEPTWSLIDPGARDAGRPTRAAAGSRTARLSQLDLILDDLERL